MAIVVVSSGRDQHSGAAQVTDLFQKLIAGLTAALNDPATKSEAGTIIRNRLSEV